MPAPVWPTSLPTNLQVSDYGETGTEVTVSTQMDVGNPKIRRRQTAKMEVFKGSLTLTKIQMATLMSFYDSDCAGGAISFTWKQFRTGVSALMRFAKHPDISAITADKYIAQLEFEKLPT